MVDLKTLRRKRRHARQVTAITDVALQMLEDSHREIAAGKAFAARGMAREANEALARAAALQEDVRAFIRRAETLSRDLVDALPVH